MKKPISKSVMDQVVKLREAGISLQDVSDILGESYFICSRIYGAYKRAKSGDVDGLIASGYQRYVTEWAAAKCGLSLEKRVPKPAPVPAAKPEALPKPDNTALAMGKLLDKVEQISVLLQQIIMAIDENGKGIVQTQQVVSAQQAEKTQKILYGLASTMHNEAADLKKAMNANADMISKDLVQSRDHLQQIRSNTKK